MARALREQPQLSEMFMAFLLTRSIQVESDLIDQLFNSSERRLARLLLLALLVWTIRPSGQTTTGRRGHLNANGPVPVISPMYESAYQCGCVGN